MADRIGHKDENVTSLYKYSQGCLFMWKRHEKLKYYHILHIQNTMLTFALPFEKRIRKSCKIITKRYLL